VRSFPAFRISHTPAHPSIPAPVPGAVCVFCCNSVLRDAISLSVEVLPAPGGGDCEGAGRGEEGSKHGSLHHPGE